jgi:C4-dicarboxylate transporter
MSVDGQSTTDQSLGTLVANVTANVSSLIRLEIELVKTELAGQAKQGVVGIALIAVGGLLGFLALVLGSFAAVYGFAEVMPVWAAFLVVAGIYLVLAALLAFVASRRFRKVRGPARAQAQVDLTKSTFARHAQLRARAKADGVSVSELTDPA